MVVSSYATNNMFKFHPTGRPPARIPRAKIREMLLSDDDDEDDITWASSTTEVAHDCKLVLKRGVEIPFWPPDVRFEVKGAGGNGDNAASSLVTFPAHLFVLKAKAPKLAAEFGQDAEKIDKVSITDVNPAIFHLLLRSVYGGVVEKKKLIAHAKNIIDAAHKYDIFDLKLAAEAAYVKSTQITMENAFDLLLYAQALNLERLKEVVIDFHAKNISDGSEPAQKLYASTNSKGTSVELKDLMDSDTLMSGRGFHQIGEVAHSRHHTERLFGQLENGSANQQLNLLRDVERSKQHCGQNGMEKKDQQSSEESS